MKSGEEIATIPVDHEDGLAAQGLFQSKRRPANCCPGPIGLSPFPGADFIRLAVAGENPDLVHVSSVPLSQISLAGERNQLAVGGHGRHTNEEFGGPCERRAGPGLNFNTIERAAPWAHQSPPRQRSDRQEQTTHTSLDSTHLGRGCAEYFRRPHRPHRSLRLRPSGRSR